MVVCLNLYLDRYAIIYSYVIRSKLPTYVNDNPTTGDDN